MTTILAMFFFDGMSAATPTPLETGTFALTFSSRPTDLYDEFDAQPTYICDDFGAN